MALAAGWHMQQQLPHLQQRQQQQQRLAAPAAAAAAAGRKPRRRVAARGILDKWRQDNGIAVPTSTSAAATPTTTTTTTLPPPQPARRRAAAAPDGGDDDGECPVECVVEVRTEAELDAAIAAAAATGALVVVDFYKTACGACKFVAPGFVRMCRLVAEQQQQQQLDSGGTSSSTSTSTSSSSSTSTSTSSSSSSSGGPPVVFLKHNVHDFEADPDEDDAKLVSKLAKAYNVRSVPRFVFIKTAGSDGGGGGGKEENKGEVVDSFATRDKAKVAAAILAHAPPGSVEFGEWIPGVEAAAEALRADKEKKKKKTQQQQ